MDLTQKKIDKLLEKFGEKTGKIDLSLSRISAFMAKIGWDEKQLPKVIHFAGTNGKGSTLAFLKAMIMAEGKSCHAYTSPHLVRFNERIELNSEEIENSFLLEIFEEIDAAHQQHGIPLTYYELTTAAAFLAFARRKADYLLLETGLGGRLDATNIIAAPLLTIITPISIDHVEFLGDTLTKIAAEKAGIIKANVVCVSAPQESDAAEILKATAAKLAAPLVFAKVKNYVEDYDDLALKGEHQKINASTAAAAAREIGIGETAIAKGLQTAKWRARMQKLTKGTLPEILPEGFNLILDGAHNEAGAKILAAELAKTKRPAFLVTAMMERKDAKTYFAQLRGLVEHIFTIPIPGEAGSYNPQELAKAASALDFKASACNDAADAIRQILKITNSNNNSPADIYICGSLYLAGHILKDNS